MVDIIKILTSWKHTCEIGHCHRGCLGAICCLCGNSESVVVPRQQLSDGVSGVGDFHGFVKGTISRVGSLH